MVVYLSEEEIIEINRLSVEKAEEKHEVLRIDDIRFLLKFTEETFDEDSFRISLAYCVSIILLHPFLNGNHRTSIICSEHFLLKNDFTSFSTPKSDIELEKNRLEYEEKHNLERVFFYITCIENEGEKIKEIIKIMDSKYGALIENWLKENYR